MIMSLAACGSGSSQTQTTAAETTVAETTEMPTEPPVETMATTEAETVEISEIEGTYAFGLVNAFGSTVPYILCLKTDGSAAIVMDNSFTGARIYTGEWEGEDEITVKLYEWEGDNPFGDFFDAESPTYDSTWTVNPADQTAKVVGFEGTTDVVSMDALSEEAKAKIDAFMSGEALSAAGVYVYGLVNAFGSTVPYVLVLNENGTAGIVMDNSFTGVRRYTGTWEGSGNVTIKLYTWEGDSPFGDFFDAESPTYDSTWALDAATGTAKPVDFDGTSNPVSYDSLTDEAKAAVEEMQNQ